jgi:hypothetical protein
VQNPLDNAKFNVAAAVVSAAYDAANLFQFVGGGLVGQLVALVAFGAFTARWGWIHRARADALERRLKPRFTLHYEETYDSGTFIHEAGEAQGLERRYRIAVANECDADLRGLHAVIIDASPRVPGVWLERRLHPMAEAREHDGYFQVPRGGRRFVEVAREFVRDTDGEVAIIYNSENLQRRLAAGEDVRLRIQVQGADAPPQNIDMLLRREARLGRDAALREVPPLPLLGH